MDRTRIPSLAATAPVLVCSAVAGAESYCDNPGVVAEWNAMVEKYAGSRDWQRLHALWLGLWQTVREGSIGYNSTLSLLTV
jgi:hypothetical protein